MPIYSYECTAGHQFDYAQKFADKALSRCQAATCDAPCERVLTVTNFVLKGPRWAKDGYAG